MFIVFKSSGQLQLQLGFGPPNFLPAQPHNISVVLLSVLLLLSEHNGSTALWSMSHSSQLCVITKVSEDALCNIIHFIDE